MGTSEGRYGYGSIYVFASGNGGLMNDNCNFDGYANSIYTLTVGTYDCMYVCVFMRIIMCVCMIVYAVATCSL